MSWRSPFWLARMAVVASAHCFCESDRLGSARRTVTVTVKKTRMWRTHSCVPRLLHIVRRDVPVHHPYELGDDPIAAQCLDQLAVHVYRRDRLLECARQR